MLRDMQVYAKFQTKNLTKLQMCLMNNLQGTTLRVRLNTESIKKPVSL